MSIVTAIRDYFAPLAFSAQKIRQENECERANREAAAQLLREERAYWEAYMAKAATHGDREYAMDQIDRLNVLERAS